MRFMHRRAKICRIGLILGTAVAILCTGCATDATAPAVVKEAVFTPCKVDVPPRPTFPADSLTGEEDIWTLGTTLWADRHARRAYEIQLRTALEGCTQNPDK